MVHEVKCNLNTLPKLQYISTVLTIVKICNRAIKTLVPLKSLGILPCKGGGDGHDFRIDFQFSKES